LIVAALVTSGCSTPRATTNEPAITETSEMTGPVALASGVTAPPDPCSQQLPCPGEVPAGAPHCSFEDEHQLAYRVPGIENVRVECDIAYKEVEGLEATLDLYLPPDAEPGDRLPAVVFVHGNEDLPALHPIQTHWKRWEYARGLVAAASGFVGIAFDYRGYDRYAPETLADAERDVLDLLAYVGDHSDELLVDPDRICVWGTSGGGYPAAWAAIFGEPQPRCAVMFSASLDADWAPDRNPLEFVGPDMPPFFIAYGVLDSYSSGTAFIEAARTAGVYVTVEQHTGEHGFENERDPDQQGIVRLAFEFVAEHLSAR
jgi:acetyl esterase/lipase